MYSSLVNLVSDTTTQNVTKSYAGVLCYRLKKISLKIVESFNTCTGLKKKKRTFLHITAMQKITKIKIKTKYILNGYAQHVQARHQ